MAPVRDRSEPQSTNADFLYRWEGKDKRGKQVSGELYASGNAAVNSTLQRQGIWVTRVRSNQHCSGVIDFPAPPRA